jgi:hypothetical protein
MLKFLSVSAFLLCTVGIDAREIAEEEKAFYFNRVLSEGHAATRAAVNYKDYDVKPHQPRKLQEEGSLFDLFVRSRQLQINNSSLVCDTCDPDPDCYAFNYYYVEGQCLRSPYGLDFVDDSSENFVWKEVFDITLNVTASRTSTVICRDTFTDAECSEGAIEFECLRSWEPNTCQDNYDKMIVLDDWCKVGSVDSEYTVPMVKVSIYETGLACSADLETQEYLVPSDPTFCQHAGVAVGNETVKGSRVTYCDENNVLRFQYYEDENCTIASDDISSGIEHFDQCVEQADGFFSRAFCSNPTIACKSLSGTELGEEIVETVAPIPGKSPNLPLDLYVETKNGLYNSTTGEVRNCYNCDKPEICFQRRQYFIQNQCVRGFVDGMSRTYQGDPTGLCQVSYESDNCDVNELDHPCAPFYVFDTCNDDGTEYSMYEDWCIAVTTREELDEARAAGFDTPMVFMSLFTSYDACVSDTNAVDSYAFADSSFCQAWAVPMVDGSIIHGSYTVECSSDDAGDFVYTRWYSDETCTSQDSNLQETESKRYEGDACTESPPGSGQFWRIACMSTTIFCKNMYDTTAGFQIV